MRPAPAGFHSRSEAVTCDLANGPSANGDANSGCEGSLCRWRAGNSRAANRRNIVRSRPSKADHSSDSMVAGELGRNARLAGSVHGEANLPSSFSSVEMARIQNPPGSAPLPYPYLCLDQLLDRPCAREVTGSDPAYEVCAPIEVLYRSDARREPMLHSARPSGSAPHPEAGGRRAMIRDNIMGERKTNIIDPDEGNGWVNPLSWRLEPGQCVMAMLRQQ